MIRVVLNSFMSKEICLQTRAPPSLFCSAPQSSSLLNFIVKPIQATRGLPGMVFVMSGACRSRADVRVELYNGTRSFSVSGVLAHKSDDEISSDSALKSTPLILLKVTVFFVILGLLKQTSDQKCTCDSPIWEFP